MMDMHVTLFLRCQLVSVTQLSGKAMLCLNKIVWMLNSTLCSSALQLRVRLSMLCSIALPCSGSAKDAYNFYFSSAVVVYVALVHCVEIDNVSIDGSIRPVWLI